MGDVDADIYRTRVQDALLDINDSLDAIERHTWWTALGAWSLIVVVGCSGLVHWLIGGK